MEVKKGNGSHTKILGKIYYNLQDPDSYGSSPYALLKRARKEGAFTSLKEVKGWVFMDLLPSEVG